MAAQRQTHTTKDKGSRFSNLKPDELRQEIGPNVFQLHLWQDPPWLSILPFLHVNSFDGVCDYCQYLTGISCQAAGQFSIVPFPEATCRMRARCRWDIIRALIAEYQQMMLAHLRELNPSSPQASTFLSENGFKKWQVTSAAGTTPANSGNSDAWGQSRRKVGSALEWYCCSISFKKKKRKEKMRRHDICLLCGQPSALSWLHILVPPSLAEAAAEDGLWGPV